MYSVGEQEEINAGRGKERKIYDKSVCKIQVNERKLATKTRMEPYSFGEDATIFTW